MRAVRYQTELPEFSSWFWDCNSKVENVRKRLVPVRPVEGDDGVVSSKFACERTYKESVCVAVDTAVLQHDVRSPHVTHVRYVENLLSVDLPHTRPKSQDLLSPPSGRTELAEIMFSSDCPSVCKCMRSEPVNQRVGALNANTLQLQMFKATDFLFGARVSTDLDWAWSFTIYGNGGVNQSS